MRIDYRNHLALLAEVFQGGRETMIGEARYVVDERDPPVRGIRERHARPRRELQRVGNVSDFVQRRRGDDVPAFAAHVE